MFCVVYKLEPIMWCVYINIVILDNVQPIRLRVQKWNSFTTANIVIVNI